MTFKDFIEQYKKQKLIKEQQSSYNGIEKLIGRALMLVKGYRPNNGYQHKTVVDFAAMVLGSGFKTLTQHFEKMRRKRNLFIYELSISISETEVDNALKSATTFISAIKEIIEKENPQFKFKFQSR